MIDAEVLESLDRARDLARSGAPQLLIVSNSHFALPTNKQNAGELWLTLQCDPSRPRPLSPFLDILASWVMAVGEVAARQTLDRAEIYHRHRLLLSIAAGLSPPEAVWKVEELILEDLLMEQNLLKASLGQLLRAAATSLPLVVHCRSAEFLAIESLELFRTWESWLGTGVPLVLVLDFSTPIPGSAQEHFLLQCSSRGLVLHLDAPRDPAPAAPVPQLTAVDWELLVQLLAFDTVLELSRSLAPTLEMALWKARCHEARQDYEEALLELQGLSLALADGTDRQQVARLRISARQYRFLNDLEMANRLAWQAHDMTTERSVGDESLKTDFLLFQLSSVVTFEADTLDQLGQRLEASLKASEWGNHQAFFWGQAASAARVARLQGHQAAIERCAKAVKLSRKLQNSRRLGASLHALALVWQMAGDFQRSDRVYRRIPDTYGDSILPQELARTLNGHGFLLSITGQYQRALKAHSTALQLLRPTRHFEETLVTSVNVARIQLFTGWPAEARRLLESILVVLDELRIRYLPFMGRDTVEALFGLASLQDGQLIPALEVERRLAEDAERADHDPHSTTYRAWFRARMAMAKGKTEDVEAQWNACRDVRQTHGPELRYLSVRILLDEAGWNRERGASEQAKDCLLEALSWCLPLPHHAGDRELIQAALAGQPAPPPPRLFRVDLDPRTIIESVQQDQRLRAWRLTARTSEFLRAWQETLALESDIDKLLDQCRTLLRRYFLLEEIILDELSSLRERLPRSWGNNVLWLEAADLEGTGYRAASWIPAGPLQRDAPSLFVASRKGPPWYTVEEHRVILIAMRHLDTTLQARQGTRELEDTNRKLSQALDDLKRTQTQLVLSEKLAALGGLVAGIAHEINTPLGVALTGVSYQVERTRVLHRHFQEGSLGKKELEEYLASMLEGGDIAQRNLFRADKLIQNFKQVASDQTSEERRLFVLKEYLADVLSSLEPQWKKAPVRVELEGPDGVEMDSFPGALAQVVTNLVVNALVHAFGDSRSGTLVLQVMSPRDGHVEVRFRDDGAGIAPANVGQIFDPFFTTRRNKGGTGMGLHIVFNLVHQVLRGTIRCTSTLGKGTTFYLTLPLKP